MTDSGHFIRCPGKNGKYCSATIPKVIVCTQANKGMRCQRCDRCGYFTWLDGPPKSTPSHLASSFTLPTPFFTNDITVYSQFDSQFDLPSTPFQPEAAETLLSVLTQAMAMQAAPTSYQPPPSSQPPTSTQPDSRRDRCLKPGCTSNCTAAKCSTGLCARHCKESDIQCLYSKHNTNNLRPVVKGAAPWKLDRPMPSQPTISNPDSHETPPDPFSFRKPLPPDWEADYNRRKRERDLTVNAANERALNEKKINHRVNLWVYKQVKPLFMSRARVMSWECSS